MKLHQGDSVVVIAGKDKGKQGTIIRVLEDKNRVVVETINMRTRHIKKTAQGAGSRIKDEASIHASNVMLIDPKTKKGTRVGYKIDAKGKKVRVSKSSSEVLPLVSKAKAKDETKGKKKAAGTKEKEDETKKSAKEEKEMPETAGPAKQPFWKRAFNANEAEGTQGETRNRQEENDKNSPSSIRRSRESS